MSYEMYAYRPSIGVAVCKNDKQWLLVDLEDERGESKVISEQDSLDLAKHLSLLHYYKVFHSFGQLHEFLLNEYRTALEATQNLEGISSIEDDLEFLDKEFVLGWLTELQTYLKQDNFEKVDPKTVKENLAILARHPKFEADLDILVSLNPLRNAWERKFAIPSEILNNPTEREANDAMERFPQLNGRALVFKNGIRSQSNNLQVA